MKKLALFAIIFLGIAAAFYFLFKPRLIVTRVEDLQPTGVQPSEESDQEVVRMQITSSSFNKADNIPEKYTCDGDNVNPALSISDVPEEAKSLVLIMDDPDAPAGTWNHWLIFNIDPKTKEISEDSVPDGANLGTNDFGKLEYGGPCPPIGVHRYYFRLYALDNTLELAKGAKRADIEKAMQGHVLNNVELMGKYQKK